MLRSGRPVLALLALGGCLALATASGPTASAADPLTPPTTPRAVCGPGSIPETGMQGRVSAADVTSGKVKNGFRCNLVQIGHVGLSGGYKVERYVDKAGHECAYFDTTLLFPTNATNIAQKGTGVAVVDMTKPAKPVITTTLLTPAMDSPHESMLVNQKRGLLAAVAGNPIFAPGQVDVYDLTADCRNPAFQSSTPTGVMGHEAGFAPDGMTYYVASLGGGTLTAVDLTNPLAPTIAYVGHFDTHSLSISDDGTRAYLAAGAGFPRNEVGLQAEVSGLRILDVSDIQKRALNPQPTTISTLTWPTVTIPQTELPITIGGHPYLVDIDEFATDDKLTLTADGPRVGAGRIIDIADEKHPKVVSDIRLAVHQPAARAGDQANDPGANSPVQGYAAHYCSIPTRTNPNLAACSMILSGLRVFDIRDVAHPKEVGYFNKPVAPGENPLVTASEGAFAMSQPAWDPSHDSVWYSDGNSGFYDVRLTNGLEKLF